MTLYEDDTFVCPQCGQHAISNNDLKYDLIGGEPEHFECPECGWQGEDPDDWPFWKNNDRKKQ